MVTVMEEEMVTVTEEEMVILLIHVPRLLRVVWMIAHVTTTLLQM